LIAAFNSANAANELLLTTATTANNIVNGSIVIGVTIYDVTASAVAALAACNAAMETFNTALAAYSTFINTSSS